VLTKAGWAAVATGAVLLVASALLGFVELAALAVACLIAVALGLLWVQPRPRLAVDRLVEPLRLTVGEDAISEVRVENQGSRSSLPLVARDKVGGEFKDVPLPRLKPGAHREKRYRLPTNRRAVLDVGPLVIVRSDPFGLVQVDQDRGDQRQVFVHPRRFLLRPLPATFERSLEGPTSDSAPRGSQAFHQLREYVPGDDRRMIHWKQSARTGDLVVRQHVDTSLPDLTIILDSRSGQYRNDQFEIAVEIVASLIVACSDNGFPVRLRTTDGSRYEAPPGQHATTYFLDRLAGIKTGVNGDLISMSQVLQQAAAGYALIAVSGHPTAEDVRSLTPLVRRYSNIILADADPDPDQHHLAAGVRRIDAPTGQEFADIWNHGGLG